jgi:Ca2+-dependent lipid-binding protein
VRIYVLGCFDLASRDTGGESDPYLWMQLGKQIVDQRSKHQNDEPNPEINEVFDFEAIFPGCPMLHIKMMDYDMVFGDEVIGETFVDLEDRYFSPEWRSVKDMPVEYRRLYHNSSKAEQGIFKMWAELIPVNEAPNVKKWDITAKPAEHLEIRVVVWGSKNLKMMDAEGTCDAFVRLFFDPKHKKETDVHYRNSDGKANWNYRLLFPFDYNSSKMNENDCTLTVQTYDLDLLTANDLVGQATINLEPLLQDVELTHR